MFSIVGTQVAGDTGMNIVGCTLVGCVAAIRGGSLNAVMYGAASPLLGQPGVRWVAFPSYLLVAISASILTFFGWPYYCRLQANQYIQNVIGKENLESNGRIGLQAFCEAWKRDALFRTTIRDALPHVKSNAGIDPAAATVEGYVEGRDVIGTLAKHWSAPQKVKGDFIDDGHLYFEDIDSDSSGDIDIRELERVVQHRFYNGWETYWMDTMGLSALSIFFYIYSY